MTYSRLHLGYRALRTKSAPITVATTQATSFHIRRYTINYEQVPNARNAPSLWKRWES
jgi:hypothetical protein